jgi:GPH family glycoside/pentoside/hexuronide:cation symporter
MTAARRLRRRTIVLYALPNASYSVAALPLALFVPAFYADDLGLPLAQVGLAIALSRLLDVVTDPLLGQLSDRLRTRFGRRKPWIALGTPILLLALWQLFVPGERGEATLVGLFGWTALLFVGFTMVDLPFKAWGAELSVDYAERSRVAAWREAFGFAGQVGLLLLLLGLAQLGLSGAQQQLYWIALVMLATLPVLVAVSLARVAEPPPSERVVQPLGLGAGLRLVASNPAFARMVAAVLFFVSGVVVQGTLHRLVLTHVFGREDLFPLMIFAENALTLAAVPLWLRVSYRIEKHRAIALAALWIAVFSLALPFFTREAVIPFIACMVLRGSSFASILFLSNSIVADVVDFDEVASGRQRTGLFFGVFGMVTKAALALGVLIATALPAALGFDPGMAAPSDAAVRGMLGIYGFLPGALMAAGAHFLWRFPLTREVQAALRSKLEPRSSA